LPWLDWRFSLIFPVAILLLAATLIFQMLNEDEYLEVVVTDSTTGQALEGALVTIGDATYASDGKGEVRIERPVSDVVIRVTAQGYQSVSGNFTDANGSTQTVPLQPATVTGKVTDKLTGQPLADIEISLIDQFGVTLHASSTATDGSYTFVDVPRDAWLVVDAGAYGTFEETIGQSIVKDFSFELKQARGRVLDAAGNPIQGAIVRSGSLTAISTGDGTFVIDGVADGATVNIAAAGFADQEAVVANGVIADARLMEHKIKATYADLNLLMEEGGIEQHIEIANTTEINAIVIDIKQDTIYYDSQVEFFREAGTVSAVYDARALLEKLKDNDIYAIARLVVFQDPLVAEARPDLAVMDSVTGDLWRNELGIAWVSAFNEELWDANIALAVEALELGFDEIQYDYVRFPSDGDLTTAEFGRDYTAEARETAITGFMKQSYEAIHTAGGKLAADLFGFVTIVDDEQYIGQRFSALEPYLDFVCMMIYPSHFQEGNIASAPGHPNDYPYETIFESLERAELNVPGAKAKFRPWLQDFTYWGMREYTPDDVRLQIDAAEDFGTSGWMLWGDPFNVSVEALKAEE
jgi:hypothetical protein